MGLERTVQELHLKEAQHVLQMLAGCCTHLLCVQPKQYSIA